MKLCTFEVTTPVGPFRRLGAAVESGGAFSWIDLNVALAAQLVDRGAGRAQPMADALIPPEMMAFGAAGPGAMEAAEEALEFALENEDAAGPRGEQLRYSEGDSRLLAPIPQPQPGRSPPRDHHTGAAPPSRRVDRPSPSARENCAARPRQEP